MKIYINGIGSVSAQDINSEGNFFEHFKFLSGENVYAVKAPNYKDYISAAASRRMASGVKNASVASADAMTESGIKDFDAIITGTGMGCIEDSHKFLTAIIDNGEQFLTPTSFIQSTHNTVAGNIAVTLGCKAYNFTYVNGAVSFESALLDAKMQIDSGEAKNILVGAVDEMTEYTAKLFQLAGFIKKEISEKKAASFSEGATFFVLSNIESASTYCEILDVETSNVLEKDEEGKMAINFLKNNNLSPEDIDVLIIGINDDSDFTECYDGLKNLFSKSSQAHYKHLSGEYFTASAFGLMCAANILKAQKIPEVMLLNKISRGSHKNVLLYNQYRGKDHSFVLISSF